MKRALSCVLLTFVALALVVGPLVSTAFADQSLKAKNTGPPQAKKKRPAKLKAPLPDRPTPSDADADDAAPHPERFQHSKAVAALFWIVALMVVGGSLFVITRRNLISAVMGMVGTFFGIAVLYVMLYAHFMAVIQVLVYAGAIMVLFVFVVMILNRPEDEPWARQSVIGKALAIGASAYLLLRIGGVMWNVTPPDPKAGEPPAAVTILTKPESGQGPPIEEEVPFGSSKAVANTLFQDYLFPFEAVSLVLLIAVVGAIAVARPRDDEPEPPSQEAEQSA